MSRGQAEGRDQADARPRSSAMRVPCAQHHARGCGRRSAPSAMRMPISCVRCAHRVGHHAVDPHRGQEQREARRRRVMSSTASRRWAVRSDQTRRGCARRRAGSSGSAAAHRRAQRRRPGSAGSPSVRTTSVKRADRVLQVGQVQLDPRVLVHAVVLHVRHHAHHLQPRVLARPRALAELHAACPSGLSPGPVGLREGLVHHAHGRRVRPVALVEDAPLQHAHAHGAEVVGADARDVGRGQLAGRRLRPALHAEGALPAAQQRQGGARRPRPRAAARTRSSTARTKVGALAVLGEARAGAAAGWPSTPSARKPGVGAWTRWKKLRSSRPAPTSRIRASATSATTRPLRSRWWPGPTVPRPPSLQRVVDAGRSDLPGRRDARRARPVSTARRSGEGQHRPSMRISSARGTFGGQRGHQAAHAPEGEQRRPGRRRPATAARSR